VVKTFDPPAPLRYPLDYSRTPTGTRLVGFCAAKARARAILDTLKIREAVKAKHNMVPAPVPLGPGEYEINIYPLSEILPNENLRNTGPVIPELQVPAVVTATISASTPNAAAAKALVKFLQGPAIEPALKEMASTAEQMRLGRQSMIC
jgi:ABC-type molybdate transport system substrate-binding protein